MQQGDENINRDESDSELIDVDNIEFDDEQTPLDLLENEALDFSDEEFEKNKRQFYEAVNSTYRAEVQSLQAERSKFDSRTFVKPKRRPQRPTIQNMVDVVRNATPSPNKFMTYNKYTSGPINPILRLKTFNVDTDTENSSKVKEFAMKRRSLLNEEDTNMDECDPSLASNGSDHVTRSKPINIDLSQTANNIHSSFDKVSKYNMYGSPGMFQSGDSLMRVSPPSLVNSLLDHSGNFNDLDATTVQKDIEIPATGRESQNHMLTSMATSLLDDKDLNTSFLSQNTNLNNSFLSQTTNLNNSFLNDPPSLVSSVNTSYVGSMTKSKNDTDLNIFSSTTFTNLESNKLLTARPRISYNINKTPPTNVKPSESYTKAREEGCQIGPIKSDTTLQNENVSDTTEQITIHYSNNKYKIESEKENFNTSFEKYDAFYKEVGLEESNEPRNSLNLTLDKQELNEIIQARQKLSLARKALPNEVKNETKTIQLPNAVITVPKQSIENAMELLSRRRGNNGYDKDRDTPKRNATFKKVTQRAPVMDATTVIDITPVNDDERMIDIDSATLGLADQTLKSEWSSEDRAMVGSGESTDTGTHSSSTPPDHTEHILHPERVSSTPLTTYRKNVKPDLIDIHHTISPILDATVNDKSYTVVRTAAQQQHALLNKGRHTNTHLGEQMEHTFDVPKPRINTATLVKGPKRDILAGRGNGNADNKAINVPSPLSPTHAGSCESLVGGVNSAVPRKTNLPTSKLKQFSSHRELSRIPGSGAGIPRVGAVRGGMSRRPVYSSNPALSPTASLNNQSPLVPKQPPQPSGMKPPTLVRQGTETLRRERPNSQIHAPKDYRAGAATSTGSPMRNHIHSPSPTRPYSIAGTSQLRNQLSRPAVPSNKLPVKTPSSTDQRAPVVNDTVRVSALPRPSRLPAPRRTLRPPSVYAAAPTDNEHY